MSSSDEGAFQAEASPEEEVVEFVSSSVELFRPKHCAEVVVAVPLEDFVDVAVLEESIHAEIHLEETFEPPPVDAKEMDLERWEGNAAVA
jgi:hypothetical protein